ncbi:MAG: tetratricopeptide repeat protein [Sandaracinus sp.]
MRTVSSWLPLGLRRRASLWLWRSMIVLGSVLVPVSVHAQDDSAEGRAVSAMARDEEARSLFEAGRTAFSDGRFEDALGHFERSYALSGRPQLLYNIAAAQDRLRRDEEAIGSFERYLAELPGADNRAEVEGRLEALRAAVAARRSADTADTADSERPVDAPILATIVLGTLAVVSAGLATGFWIAANDQYGTLERTCASGCTRDEVLATGIQSNVDLTNGFLVAAIALGVGTVVAFPLELMLAGGHDEASQSARLRVAPMGLVLEGTL